MLTSNYVRKRPANIRPFAAAHPEQVTPDERLYELQHNWQPLYVTFAELYEYTYDMAFNATRRFMPNESAKFYEEAVQAAYIILWEKLQSDPRMFVDKPWRYVVIWLARRSQSHGCKQNRHWHLSLNAKGGKSDAMDYNQNEHIESHIDPYTNRRRPGDPHAGFEQLVDARIDFDAIYHHLIGMFQDQDYPEAHIELVWRVLPLKINATQIAELAGERKPRYWQDLRNDIRNYLKDCPLLAEWKPRDLAEAMAADPTPYCKLAEQYAEQGEYKMLAALYFTLTKIVEAKEIYDGPMFPHPMKTFFRHKSWVVADLMHAYGIYNPEY